MGGMQVNPKTLKRGWHAGKPGRVLYVLCRPRKLGGFVKCVKPIMLQDFDQVI
jgi:hypothetical protein